METAVHRHRLRWTSAYTSAISNHKQAKKENVRTHTGLGMTMRGVLALKRVLPSNSNPVITNSNYPPRSLGPRCRRKSMADEAPNKTLPYESATKQGIDSKAKEDDAESKQSRAPPPPEKPLPGDCCGSGCVRCVWDVYYEELEEYNKLYKTESEANSNSKSS
ncbi:hypothetical protein FEM48_Zijuj08G0093300 [Ziziphus jujuba var. spinosa]|nr:hypothetical protein FEM48_Zijuj08G0093300 [Ziziphus jujuba var. spinosa]